MFDQRLEEDPRINRLEDSIILWKSICSAKLLAKTQLILFLNKCDLLKRKLKRGIKVNRYLPNYGSRPNDTIDVLKCTFFWCNRNFITYRYLDMRQRFSAIQIQSSPVPRSAHIFATTVIVCIKDQLIKRAAVDKSIYVGHQCNAYNTRIW